LNLVLQAKNRLHALSWLESFSGPRHAPQWTCVCKINGQEKGRGTGGQKQAARDIAANQALRVLIDEKWP
ncbi:hypothetical protein GYMLUDRAFT_150255, partial [Collybiopsis luxurians FD-317 M1]